MSKKTIFRLDRWLVSHGIGSRKEVTQKIRQEEVKVDGKVVTQPDLKFPEGTEVTVDDKTFNLRQYVYYMMFKPKGVLSTTHDEDETTVLDILPVAYERPGLFPAGRLDKDTEGFMLITNDGDLAHKILSPKNKVPKTYVARINKTFDFEELKEEFSKGVQIGDDLTSPAELRMLALDDQPLVEVIIYEGMYHQVKRMFKAFDLDVIYLKRTKIGGLELDDKMSAWDTKELSEDEIQSVFSGL